MRAVSEGRFYGGTCNGEKKENVLRGDCPVHASLTLRSRRQLRRSRTSVHNVHILRRQQRGKIVIDAIVVRARGTSITVKEPGKACVAVRTPRVVRRSTKCRESVSLRLTGVVQGLLPKGRVRGGLGGKLRITTLIIKLNGQRIAPSTLKPEIISGLFVAHRVLGRFKGCTFRERSIKGIDKVIPKIVTRANVRYIRVLGNIMGRAGPSFLVAISTLTTEDVQQLKQAVRLASAKVAPKDKVNGRHGTVGHGDINIPIVSLNIPAIISTTAVISSTVARFVSTLSLSSLRGLSRERQRRLTERLLSPRLGNLFIAPGGVSSSVGGLDFLVSRKLGVTLLKSGRR